MTAILRQLVTTLKEVSPVLVAMDSQAMDPPARVNISINLFLKNINKLSHIHYKGSGIQHISISNFLPIFMTCDCRYK